MPELLQREVEGVGVLVIADPSLPIVRYAIATRHGALFDATGAAGTARAMLELTLRGTQKRDRSAFADTLEEFGSGVGAALRADFGVLTGAALRRHLDATLALVTEAVLEPAFADAERERYLDEVREELVSLRDDDRNLADLFLRRAMYRDHPLARLAAGEMADLDHITRDVVADAHADAWRRERALLVLAGDVTLDDACALATPLCRQLTVSSMGELAVPPVPPISGPKIVVVDRPDRSQVQMRVACFGPGIREPDALAFWMGVSAFGGTFTSPFTREVRDVRGWSYFAHSDFDRKNPRPSSMVLSSAPAAKDAVDCLALELELYAGLCRGEIGRDALEFTRTFVLNRYPFNLATAADMMLPVLRNTMLGLPLDEILTFPTTLGGLDLSTVGPALRRHLDPSAYVATLVATASEVVPRLRERFPTVPIEVIDFRDGLDLEEP